jgi:hypothetical protein
MLPLAAAVLVLVVVEVEPLALVVAGEEVDNDEALEIPSQAASRPHTAKQVTRSS